MFHSVIKVGMAIQKTLSDIEHLESEIAQWVMIHNLQEETLTPHSTRSSELAKGHSASLIKVIEPRIDHINKMIKGLNMIGTVFKNKHKVELIDKKELFKIIKERFLFVADKDDVRVNNENFELKKSRILFKTRESISTYMQRMDIAERFDDLSRLEKKHANQIKNAIDITSMGIYDIGTFTAGRAVEDCINSYLRKLFQNKKMKRFSLTEVKFVDKIGKLKGANIINEKLYHDLSSVRISRNDSGHPVKTRFTRTDAIEAINLSISLVNRLSAKSKKLTR